MNMNRVYRRCHLTGKGELKTDLDNSSFIIHDISASGASIEISTPLETDKIHEMKITFVGHRIDITIHAKVKITRSNIINGKYLYGVTFIDLTENEKVQIDEIVNYQCNIDEHTLGENCDEQNCLIFRKKAIH